MIKCLRFLIPLLGNLGVFLLGFSIARIFFIEDLFYEWQLEIGKFAEQLSSADVPSESALIRLTDAYKLCGIIMKKYGGDVAMFRSESVWWLIVSLVLCMFKFVTLRKEDVK
jgi:hypothetical protein